MKKLKPEEREPYLKKKAAERETIQKSIQELSVKRATYVSEELKKLPQSPPPMPPSTTPCFDLHDQAGRRVIRNNCPPPYHSPGVSHDTPIAAHRRSRCLASSRRHSAKRKETDAVKSAPSKVTAVTVYHEHSPRHPRSDVARRGGIAGSDCHAAAVGRRMETSLYAEGDDGTRVLSVALPDAGHRRRPQRGRPQSGGEDQGLDEETHAHAGRPGRVRSRTRSSSASSRRSPPRR